MMIKYKYSPFTMQLLNLSNPDLIDADRDLCGAIIDQLLINLDEGHSCISLNSFVANPANSVSIKQILASLECSGLVRTYLKQVQQHALKPLILLKVNPNKPDYLLYINRYFHYENKIADYVTLLNQRSAISDELLNQNLIPLHIKHKFGFPNAEQLAAIQTSARQKLSIIAGGPGTGKTTSVVLILWLLTNLYKTTLKQLHIHVCAPTGKATKRVAQSITQSLDLLLKELNLDIQGVADNVTYSTIHKLLGYKRNSIYFKYNRLNPLDLDILIIDESSMISLPLFYKLLLAIDFTRIKHVIFLGDKDQLSSVEEGYVFASLIKYFQTKAHDLFNVSPYVELIQSKRSNSSVSQLALSIKSGVAAQVVACFTNLPELRWYPSIIKQLLSDLFINKDSLSLYTYAKYLLKFQHNLIENRSVSVMVNEIFNQFNQFVVLCLSNKGIFGVDNLNIQIESKIKLILQINDIWYTGRPIMILENDYNLDLHNGDIGICFVREKQAVVVFADGREFIPEILPKHQLAYAMTIHKSQGSEFDKVVIVLPEDKSLDYYKNLLTKELIYTAVTRAKSGIILYSGEEVLQYMLNNPTKRVSGLTYLLHSNT